jgi:hypothetical protein
MDGRERREAPMSAWRTSATVSIRTSFSRKLKSCGGCKGARKEDVKLPEKMALELP